MAKARAQLIFLDNNHGDNKNKVVITKEAVRHFGPSVVDLKELLNQPEDNKNIIIGRGALSTVVDCRISVRESSKSNDIISRKHAEIKYISKLDAFVINDLNSSNGTFVNSVRIDSHTLCDGDIIQFGGSSCLAVGDEFRGNSPCIRYRFCYDVQPYPDGPGQGRKRTHMKE